MKELSQLIKKRIEKEEPVSSELQEQFEEVKEEVPFEKQMKMISFNCKGYGK